MLFCPLCVFVTFHNKRFFCFSKTQALKSAFLTSNGLLFCGSVSPFVIIVPPSLGAQGGLEQVLHAKQLEHSWYVLSSQ